ncbi:MAG: hypothetical protein R2824_15685, partial [Saprospiraceae bacterium]
MGVLLFQEFPVTTLYSDTNGLPLIKEWIDCDDEADRLLLYLSSKENLKKFLDGEISQGELIRNSVDDLVFVIDEMDGQIKKIKLISTSQIPDEYLPLEDSFFNSQSGVQTQKIIEFFNLDNIEVKPLNLDEQLKRLAKQKNSEVFNLHLKEGNGIRHGRVDTDVLGATLLSFDDLYKEVALDYFFGRNRGELRIPSKDKREKLGLSTTEVFLSKAASFIIYIKPKYKSQFNLFEKKTTSQLVTENLFNLFEISKEEKSLEESFNKYSDFVFRSYRHFLKSITEFDLHLDINWTDHTAETLISEDFTLFQANDIINSIDSMNTEETDNFKVKGKFRAINCNTGHFTFISLGDELFNGYFDDLVKDSAPLLTFTKLYEVSIERKTIKEAGKPD